MRTAKQSILLPLRAIPGSLFSFEALLVLYMFAGIYKGDPRLAAVPVDLTALFFALSVVVGSFIIVRNPIHRKSLPVIFATVCLIVWLLVSLIWSPSRIYGPNKVFELVTLVLWAVIAGAVIIAPDSERLRRLFTLVLLFALWLGIESVLIFIEARGHAGRIRVLGGGSYLALGRICGLGTLIALVACLYGRGGARWLSLIMFAFLAFVLAIGGGRAPLLAVAIPLLIVAGLGVRFTRTRILYWPAQLAVLLLFLAVAGGIVIYSSVTEHQLQTVKRLERLGETDVVDFAGNRADFYAIAMKFSAEAPVLGHGAGSWPLLNGRPDDQSYPHNLFAELLVEGGLVAVGLMLAVLGTAFRSVSFARLRSDPQSLCAVLLFMNTFLNAMTTADVPGNRAMFLMVGILALLAVRPSGAATSMASDAEGSAAGSLDLSAARRAGMRSARRPHPVSADARGSQPEVPAS